MKEPEGADHAAPPGADDAAPKGGARRAHRIRWWRSPPLRWAVAVIVLIFILEYLLLPDIANARKSLNLLGKVNILGLIVAVVLEAVSLLAYAELTHTVLSPDAPRRSLLFRINMSSLAVSHVVPGGTAPGTAVAYRLLTEQGVSSGTAAFGLATQGVGSAVVLNAIFWFSLLISIPLTGYNPLYGFAAIAGLILFVLFAGTVLLLTRGQRKAADRLHVWASKLPFVNPDRVSSLMQTVADRLQILLRDRALLRHALEWAAANWLFDAASLWVFLLAFGRAVSPIDLLVAYGLANILAVIPITPGGLGVVEGVLIPTLVGFHVPKAIAILGVLSYRLVNFWLPIPLGGVAYLSLRFGADGRRGRRGSLSPYWWRPHDGRAAGTIDGKVAAPPATGGGDKPPTSSTGSSDGHAARGAAPTTPGSPATGHDRQPFAARRRRDWSRDPNDSAKGLRRSPPPA